LFYLTIHDNAVHYFRFQALTKDLDLDI